MNRRLVLCWLVTAVVLTAAGGCGRTGEKERLEGVYMPSFSRVATPEPASQSLATLRHDWNAGGRQSIVRDIASPQGAAVGLALAVLLAVGWNYRRLAARSNIDLLLLFLPGLFFFDAMRFFAVMRNPAYLNLLDWVFSAMVGLSLALVARAVHRVVTGGASGWHPNLAPRILATLALSLLAVNAAVALARPPDDAGWFVNLGAQRLRERGRLPYGDPLLTATPGAAYGPLLYAAHVPFQVLLSPDPVNPVSRAKPDLIEGPPYYLPPRAATQLCTVFFHLIGVASLFFAVRRISSSAAVAWGTVCLYCGSLAVLGIGGRDEQVAGITFVSHIAPASMTLAAFAALPRPALSGVLLAIATGVGFYPAFMAPAWLGYFWNDRTARVRAASGFVLTGLLIAAAVFALSRPALDRSRLGTIIYDTFGHHTDPAGYGSSAFGFWGQREGIRKVLNTPLVGTSGLTTPAWLSFAAFLGLSGFLARGRRPTDLALLAGAVAVAATLVKPHATGTYLASVLPAAPARLLQCSRGGREKIKKAEGKREKAELLAFCLLPYPFCLIPGGFISLLGAPRRLDAGPPGQAPSGLSYRQQLQHAGNGRRDDGKHEEARTESTAVLANESEHDRAGRTRQGRPRRR